MIGCEELNYILAGGIILGIFTYMSQRNKLKSLNSTESDLIKKAYFDPLTSLPNKENINIILDDQIYRCQRRDKSFFTALIKLDHLADDVIIESGARLFKSIRQEDTVGYVAKGTFVIVFNEYLEESNAKIILDRINKAFEQTFTTADDKSLKISISINVNTYPDKSTVDELTH